VQAMINTATINESHEDSRAHTAISWLRDYLASGLSTDWNAACEVGDPFEKRDKVWIAIGPFLQWLRKVQGERNVDAPDVKQYLIAAGFERPDPVGYRKADGKKSSRSYWCAPLSVVE
jgi:hypothetical protein